MNELDNNTNRTRHVYQLKHFASLMGSWDFEYGAAMPYDGGEYGEGVTTRKKAVNKFSVALPKGVGAEPRVLVPAGSVGIGGSQTGIYPLATPGGWQLLGRTPLALFDPKREEPVLLRSGDRVRFVPQKEGVC